MKSFDMERDRMQEILVTLVLGLICVVLGISNMKGNISSIHSYHRLHVSEKDKSAFGKLVGIGTIVCGAVIIAYSGFTAISFFTGKPIFTAIGAVIVIAGLAIGLGLSLYAIFKFNKGLFTFK